MLAVITRRMKTVFISSLVLIASCKKILHVDPPDNQLASGQIFENDSLAQKAVIGLYMKIMSKERHIFNGAMSIYPAMSADELIPSWNAADQQFFTNQIYTNNSVVLDSFWMPAYAYIYQANICAEGLTRSKALTQSLKNKLFGEVAFIRAITYYYLVNLFGNVPLALTSDAGNNSILSRSTEAEVYRQIVLDLNLADTLLTDTVQNTYPSRMACNALLSRVYLHQKEWSLAESMSTVVINSGKYMIVNDLSKVFEKNSAETILQLAPIISKMNSPEGSVFIPPTSGIRPQYTITSGLLNSFELGDLRRTQWTQTTTAGSATYYYPYKYRVFSSANPTEYNVLMRLAEQYLVRAEARAHQNKIEGAVADINVIRSRARLSQLNTNINQAECLAAVEKERRTELFTEWGHRWIDLKRMGRANEVLKTEKGAGWQSADQLYPIPFLEIQRDPNMVQNPGY